LRKKVKNLPAVIYLQVGEDIDEEDFNDLIEVTWCKDKIYDTDIRYVLPPKKGRKS